MCDGYVMIELLQSEYLMKVEEGISSLASAHVLHDQVVHNAVDHRHGDQNAKGIGEADLIELIIFKNRHVPVAELVHHEDLERVRMEANVVAPDPPAVNEC